MEEKYKAKLESIVEWLKAVEQTESGEMWLAARHTRESIESLLSTPPTPQG